jgi:hypothetical protein
MLCLSGRNSLAYPCYLIKTYVLVIDLSVIADWCAEFTWPNLTPPTPALVMESIRKIILDLPMDPISCSSSGRHLNPEILIGMTPSVSDRPVS